MENNTPNPKQDPIEKLQSSLEKGDQIFEQTLSNLVPGAHAPDSSQNDLPEGARPGDPADLMHTNDDQLTLKDFIQESEPLYGDEAGAYNGVDLFQQDADAMLETEGGTTGGSSGGPSAGLNDALSDGNSGGMTGDDDSDARVHARRQDESNPRIDDATRLGN